MNWLSCGYNRNMMAAVAYRSVVDESNNDTGHWIDISISGIQPTIDLKWAQALVAS